MCATGGPCGGGRLVGFRTYSRINCRRSLARVKAWGPQRVADLAMSLTAWSPRGCPQAGAVGYLIGLQSKIYPGRSRHWILMRLALLS